MNPAAAFFDVDGTIVARHIVHQFVYLRTRLLPPALRPLWTAWFLARAPYYALLDRVSRTGFNRVFYRNYAGLPSSRVRQVVAGCFADVLQPNIYEEARECVAGHRRSGCRVVLVTGSIDFIIQPLAADLGAAHLIAPQLLEREGRFTGVLDGPPIGADEKVRRIRDYADRCGLRLPDCHAYGDSIADEPMLSAVGHAHAVNPDKALECVARGRGWPILRWRRRARDIAGNGS